LLPIAGVPFIDLKLRELRAAGATQVVLLAGHGGRELEEHVGGGDRFGLEVSVVHDPPELLGTGGAVCHALPKLGSEFIVTYGDTLLEVPLEALCDMLVASAANGVMTVLTNDDQWETSNVDVVDGWVTAYEKHPQVGRHRHLDYGMIALRASAFDGMSVGKPFDLADLWRSLVSRRQLRAMFVSRRFYDIGNEATIATTEGFIGRGGGPQT
jgi:MurNAc alpha-1-phosphate uridylyltransferase